MDGMRKGRKAYRVGMQNEFCKVAGWQHGVGLCIWSAGSWRSYPETSMDRMETAGDTFPARPVAVFECYVSVKGERNLILPCSLVSNPKCKGTWIHLDLWTPYHHVLLWSFPLPMIGKTFILDSSSNASSSWSRTVRRSIAHSSILSLGKVGQTATQW